MNTNDFWDLRRGKIRNPKLARQLRDFSGLRFGKITPTDIDMSLDFGGKVFVIGEAKHVGSDIECGQRRHLEYLCLSHWLAGHEATAVIVRHECTPEQAIPVADCPVSEAYIRGKNGVGRWLVPAKSVTCRDFIDRYLGHLRVNAVRSA